MSTVRMMIISIGCSISKIKVMARCTNCNEVLPFNKVAFLSKRKNIVECPRCHTFLEGNDKQLGIIGGVFGGMGAIFGFLTVYSFLNNIGIAISFLLTAILVVLIGAIIQNQVIKLKPRN